MKIHRSPLLFLALAAAPWLHAQFDFGKLTKALDTAKDAGKMFKGVAGIGPAEERIIGDSVALEVVGKYGGLVRDEETVHRVNLLGRALARYSDRPELTWRFGVLDSDTVNAFSAPDGYVFITRGLYELCPDDDRLAAVLGHEIAHITGKHALHIVERSEFLSGLGSQVSQRSSDMRKADAQLKQFDLGVTKITQTLFEKGFDPQTEYAADRTGHDLATVTGYAPGSLRAVLETLRERGGDPKTVFSSHPPLAERIKRLPAEAPASAAEDSAATKN
ncbi:MAG: M48 family metalloprotease [Opitutae bacterium]|nr:M48 family metalloprotease [Opitutae bacterium]